MKINKTLNYSKSITLFCGLLLLCFVIWNRFFRIRLPKNIDVFINNPILLFLAYCTCILFSSMIIYNCYLLLFKANEIKPKISLVSKYLAIIIKNRVVLQLIESPKIFYEFLFQKINVAFFIENSFQRIFKFLHKNNKRYNNILLMSIYFFINTLPRIIVASIFVIEILIYRELCYFYQSLILLGMPLIFKGLLYILQDLADKNTYYITAHIFIDYDPLSSNYLQVNFRDEIPPIEDATDIVTNKNNKALLQWFIKMFQLYRDIKGLTFTFYQIKALYASYETIFISSLYLFGWLCILLK